MRKLRAWFLRLSGIFNKPRSEHDLSDELEGHLQMHIEDNVRAGMTPEKARREALIKLGGLDQAKESYRDRQGVPMLETLVQDVRYAARILRKNPGFTAVVVLSLALGIGANTAIFSIINSVILQPLPFQDADQLVRLESTKDGTSLARGGYYGGPSPLDVQDYIRSNHTFQQIVVYDSWRKNVSFGAEVSEPEQMRVGLVPAAYFETLQLRPIMGRLFTDEENQPGKDYVAAISANLWKNRFAGDSAILGQKIRINDEPYTIVAVMPDTIPQWMEPMVVQIWTPFAPPAYTWSEESRGSPGDGSVARLKPGVTIAQAQADLSTIAAGLAAEHPLDKGIGVVVKPLAETRVGPLRPALLMLMGAVGMILLIACSNLANLLLARNATRKQEFAVRAALGAGRTGLIRQLLTETLLVSLIGGAAGLALARLALAILARVHPDNLPQLGAIAIDSRVLLFTLLATLLTAFLFGVAPALAGIRVNLIDGLKEGGRSGSGGSRRQRLRNTLVVTEMALSLILLVGASLLVQSIVRLERQDLGVRQDYLLKGHFYMPPVRYGDTGAITRFCDQFGDRVRALPGVIDASVTTVFPPTNGWTQMFSIEGQPVSRTGDIPSAEFGLTDLHFLKTLGIPLIRGRGFSESDNATSAPVALISEEFRRRYFPAEDPIGRVIHIGPPPFLGIAPGVNTTDSADVTIIGVIGNFRNSGLARPPEPQIVVLFSQHPVVNYGFKDIVIHTSAEPHAIVPTVERELHNLDADMPFAQVQTMNELVDQQTSGQRFSTFLLAMFAVAGLGLAVVGIYGVVSYLVTQRRQEIAVRLAVGASPTDVLWLIVRQGLRMATTGAAIGLLGAWAARQLTSQLLFGISPVDPLTYAGATIFLLAVAAIASAIPGIRAMRIDPAQALRQE
jgi:putative ABC transport system permease protein